MRIWRINTEQVTMHWPWLVQLLGPVVAGDPNGSLAMLKEKLVSGEMGIASIHVSRGTGLVVLHPGEFDGVRALWIPYIVGRVKLGPKAWLTLMRGIAAHFVSLAREEGFAEVRIGGRDWSRILPGFERFDDTPNRLRMVL